MMYSSATMMLIIVNLHSYLFGNGCLSGYLQFLSPTILYNTRLLKCHPPPPAPTRDRNNFIINFFMVCSFFFNCFSVKDVYFINKHDCCHFHWCFKPMPKSCHLQLIHTLAYISVEWIVYFYDETWMNFGRTFEIGEVFLIFCHYCFTVVFLSLIPQRITHRRHHFNFFRLISSTDTTISCEKPESCQSKMCSFPNSCCSRSRRGQCYRDHIIYSDDNFQTHVIFTSCL